MRRCIVITLFELVTQKYPPVTLMSFQKEADSTVATKAAVTHPIAVRVEPMTGGTLRSFVND